jgi:enoyl-CoA hydratase
MTEAPLLVHDDGNILVATLNRPEKLNALNKPMLDLLDAAIARFRDTPVLRVMLIRATGRYFSSGADIKASASSEMPNTGSGIREMHRRELNGMQRMYDEMEAIEKPFVVAHQAPCVGGGLELSLSCDFRLAAKSARYSFPEGLFGVLPASNGVSRLTRIVGTHWARYLIMANLPVNADRALVMGLVHEVFPDETFENDVMNFCRHLAQQHGAQMATAKIAIEMARDVGLAQARNVERLANSALMLAPDFREGRARYVNTVGKKS